MGMISAAKRMVRDAVAWEEKRPSTEKTVMAASLRSTGEEERQAAIVIKYLGEMQLHYFSFFDDISSCTIDYELTVLNQSWRLLQSSFSSSQRWQCVASQRKSVLLPPFSLIRPQLLKRL